MACGEFLLYYGWSYDWGIVHVIVDMTLSMTVALREYAMVAMSPDMTVSGRGCMSVFGKGYVSSMGIGEEKPTISPDLQEQKSVECHGHSRAG